MKLHKRNRRGPQLKKKAVQRYDIGGGIPENVGELLAALSAYQAPPPPSFPSMGGDPDLVENRRMRFLQETPQEYPEGGMRYPYVAESTAAPLPLDPIQARELNQTANVLRQARELQQEEQDARPLTDAALNIAEISPAPDRNYLRDALYGLANPLTFLRNTGVGSQTHFPSRAEMIADQRQRGFDPYEFMVGFNPVSWRAGLSDAVLEEEHGEYYLPLMALLFRNRASLLGGTSRVAERNALGNPTRYEYTAPEVRLFPNQRFQDILNRYGRRGGGGGGAGAEAAAELGAAEVGAAETALGEQAVPAAAESTVQAQIAGSPTPLAIPEAIEKLTEAEKKLLRTLPYDDLPTGVKSKVDPYEVAVYKETAVFGQNEDGSPLEIPFSTTRAVADTRNTLRAEHSDRYETSKHYGGDQDLAFNTDDPTYEVGRMENADQAYMQMPRLEDTKTWGNRVSPEYNQGETSYSPWRENTDGSLTTNVLQIPALMRGGAIDRLANKNGIINRKQLEAQIKKLGKRDQALLNDYLAHMDYLAENVTYQGKPNIDHRKQVDLHQLRNAISNYFTHNRLKSTWITDQDEINRRAMGGYIDYGHSRIQVDLNNSTPELLWITAENPTLVPTTQNDFHSKDPMNVGWARTFTLNDEPGVRYVSELQSDALPRGSFQPDKDMVWSSSADKRAYEEYMAVHNLPDDAIMADDYVDGLGDSAPSTIPEFVEDNPAVYMPGTWDQIAAHFQDESRRVALSLANAGFPGNHDLRRQYNQIRNAALRKTDDMRLRMSQEPDYFLSPGPDTQYLATDALPPRESLEALESHPYIEEAYIVVETAGDGRFKRLTDYPQEIQDLVLSREKMGDVSRFQDWSAEDQAVLQQFNETQRPQALGEPGGPLGEIGHIHIGATLIPGYNWGGTRRTSRTFLPGYADNFFDQSSNADIYRNIPQGWQPADPANEPYIDSQGRDTRYDIPVYYHGAPRNPKYQEQMDRVEEMERYISADPEVRAQMKGELADDIAELLEANDLNPPGVFTDANLQDSFDEAAARWEAMIEADKLFNSAYFDKVRNIPSREDLEAMKPKPGSGSLESVEVSHMRKNQTKVLLNELIRSTLPRNEVLRLPTAPTTAWIQGFGSSGAIGDYREASMSYHADQVYLKQMEATQRDRADALKEQLQMIGYKEIPTTTSEMQQVTDALIEHYKANPDMLPKDTYDPDIPFPGPPDIVSKAIESAIQQYVYNNFIAPIGRYNSDKRHIQDVKDRQENSKSRLDAAYQAYQDYVKDQRKMLKEKKITKLPSDLTTTQAYANLPKELNAMGIQYRIVTDSNGHTWYEILPNADLMLNAGEMKAYNKGGRIKIKKRKPHKLKKRKNHNLIKR